jgi:hypothetical protein
MPYDIEVDAEARLAYLIGHGSTSPDEGQATLVALAAHPDFEPGFGLVCDLRELDYEPTADEMMAGFDNVVGFRPYLRNRIAFVSGPALEMPSELSAALYGTEGIEAQVFAELDEARAWVKESVDSPPAA